MNLRTHFDRAKKKRVFKDAPYGQRCNATITLKDKSLAQCGRHRKVGTFCLQHSRLLEPSRHD